MTTASCETHPGSRFFRSQLKRVLAVAICAVAVMTPARANNLVVTSTADTGANTLRAQVAAANTDDTITFQSNLSGGTITLSSGQIVIPSNLTIDASALAVPINISGASTSRIFQVASPAILTLNSIVLQNGTVTNDLGGAIRVDGSLVASNCTFKFNTARGGDGGFWDGLDYGGGGGGGAGLGGAIFSDGSSLILTGCQFNGNIAQGGNGGLGNNGANGGTGGFGGGPHGGTSGFGPPVLQAVSAAAAAGGRSLAVTRIGALREVLAQAVAARQRCSNWGMDIPPHRAVLEALSAATARVPAIPRRAAVVAAPGSVAPFFR